MCKNRSSREASRAESLRQFFVAAHIRTDSLGSGRANGGTRLAVEGVEPIMEKAKTLLRASKGLLATYDRINRDSDISRESLQWAASIPQGVDKMQRLLLAGRRLTEDRVDKLLLDQRNDARETGEITEEHRTVWGLTKDADVEEGAEVTWAVRAERIERGVGKMVKGMPEEEADWRK